MFTTKITINYVVTANKYAHPPMLGDFNAFIEKQSIIISNLIRQKLGFPCKSLNIKYERDGTNTFKSFSITLDLISVDEIKHNPEDEDRLTQACAQSCNEATSGMPISSPPSKLVNLEYQSTINSDEIVNILPQVTANCARDYWGNIEQVTHNFATDSPLAKIILNMPIYVHTTLPSQEFKTDKLIEILQKVREFYTGIAVCEQNGYVTIIVHTDPRRSENNVTFESVRLHLNDILKQYNASVYTIEQKPNLPGKGVLFFQLLQQHLHTHPLMPSCALRMNNIKARYTTFAELYKAALMNALQSLAREMESIQPMMARMAIGQPNPERVLLETKLQNGLRLFNLLAIVDQEQTLLNLLRFVKQPSQETDLRKILASETFYPAAGSNVTSSTAVGSPSAEASTRLTLIWKFPLFQNESTLAVMRDKDIELLLKTLGSEVIRGNIQYKVSKTDVGFSIVILGYNVDKDAQNNFEAHVKTCLFLSGLSENSSLQSVEYVTKPNILTASTTTMSSVPTKELTEAVHPDTIAAEKKLIGVTSSTITDCDIKFGSFWFQKTDKAKSKRFAILPLNASTQAQTLAMRLSEAGFSSRVKLQPKEGTIEVKVNLEPKRLSK